MNRATIYRGHPDGSVTVDGRPLPLMLALRNHSPTGFAWGYGGSGPSQLALAILAHHLSDTRKALELYQPYKWRVVAQLPKDEAFEITGQQVADVVAVLEDEIARRS